MSRIVRQRVDIRALVDAAGGRPRQNCTYRFSNGRRFYEPAVYAGAGGEVTLGGIPVVLSGQEVTFGVVPPPEIPTFGGDDITFGGEEVTW